MVNRAPWAEIDLHSRSQIAYMDAYYIINAIDIVNIVNTMLLMFCYI